MATPQVRFYHDHVLVKEGGTKQRTPWHQDQPYYNVDGRGVSAWIPVDPVPEAGCLELVATSHRGPWLMPRTFLRGEARWFPEGSLAELPDIEADRAAFDIRRFELEPGDAIFFDFLTVHGAPGFPYPTRRRILSLRYLSAEARHAPRRGPPPRPSTASTRNSPPGRPWTIPCSRWYGPADPDDTTAAGVAMAVASGGATRSARTTRLLDGQEWVESLRKAQSSAYRPAR